MAQPIPKICNGQLPQLTRLQMRYRNVFSLVHWKEMSKTVKYLQSGSRIWLCRVLPFSFLVCITSNASFMAAIRGFVLEIVCCNKDAHRAWSDGGKSFNNRWVIAHSSAQGSQKFLSDLDPKASPA